MPTGSSLQSGLSDISHAIQLAIAPVFLLNALAALVGVLVNRLARSIDRMRALRETPRTHDRRAPEKVAAELRVLERRLRLIYLSIGLNVTCALLVGATIIVAFVDAFVAPSLAPAIALLFGSGMVAFLASLLTFLREIVLAVTQWEPSLTTADADLRLLEGREPPPE